MAASARSLVDGLAAQSIPVTDRGFTQGDGVFRTVRVDAGRRWLWTEHLQRLTADCGRLSIPFPQALRDAVEADAAALCGTDSGILRVVITRGSGPRGDRPPAAAEPRRILVFFPGAAAAQELTGRRIRVCRVRIPVQPETAGIKHLNRLPQVLARSEWDGPEPAEGLLLDPDGAVVCGTMSNVFLRRGRCLSTPLIDRCGVAGVVREQILAGRIPGLADRVDEVAGARISLDDLQQADEVFVTNAVIGLWPVALLDDPEGERLADWTVPGPVTQCIFEGLTGL